MRRGGGGTAEEKVIDKGEKDSWMDRWMEVEEEWKQRKEDGRYSRGEEVGR